VEAPLAAVRRHVAANESPPPYVDTMVRHTYHAVLRGLLAREPKRRGRKSS
jgi:hypothetical protein